MFRALGARLTLDHKGVPGVAVFEAAAQRTWVWGTTGLKTATDLFAEGELQESGISVTALRSDAGNRSLCRIAVHRPDTWDPSTLWLTTVDIVRTDDSVEVGVSVEQDMTHHRVPPSPLHPPLVELLHDLVARGATAGTQRVRSTTEVVIGSEQIDALVQGCLLDPGRRLPVVLFSAIKEADGQYPADAGDPELAARELCGLAHVYVMPRVEDSHRLTKRLHMLSVYDGAVRIYWPRLRLTDPPPRHPLHLRQRLNTGSGPAIIRRVVEAGARSYRPPDGTLTLLATRWRDHEVERVGVIASDPDPVRQASLLREELLRVIDSNVALEHEMDGLRHQLMMATDRSDRLEAELAALRGPADTSTELTGRPAISLSEAVGPDLTDIST
jgi:hypothetical protein